MSSIYKFKMVTRQNLTRMKLCCFSIGWCFPIVLQYGKNQSDAKKRWKRQGEVGSPLQRIEEGSSRERMGPHSPVYHPSLPGSPCPQDRRRRGRWGRLRSGWRKQGGSRMWEDLHCHCQLDSWPRWLQRPDHLLWVRRSQSGGSSNLPWKAKPPEGIPPGWKGQKDQEVPVWHSCSSGDLADPKEHWAPRQVTPLLMVSLWDSPWSGQIWLALQREHHYMPAGSCRGICGQSHGRCQPMHHTC